MPKLKTGLPTDEPDATGFSSYDGPLPPAGVYKGLLKLTRVKVNKNNDNMLNLLVEIKEPKGSPKSRFNGCPVWGNINLTESGAPFARMFAEGIGSTYKELIASTQLDNEDPPNVIRVGKVKLDGNDKAVTITARTNNYQGNQSLQIGQFVVPKSSDEDEVADGEEEDEDEDDLGEDADEPEDDDPGF